MTEDSKLDEIKAKKMKEYQEAFQKQQVKVIKKAALLRYMTKEARERLNRVKLVKPDIAEQVELALLQALQAGQIRERVTEVQLKQILQEIMQSKRKSFHVLKK